MNEKNGLMVSVIIPSYQNGEELPQAVDSVLEQDFTNFEIIIVDNASTDDTSAICSQLLLRDSRINVIRLEQNCGPAGARNAGVEKARGKYLAFLDADDVWLANKLGAQVAILENDPDVSLVFCDGILIDEQSGEERIISDINKVFKRPLGLTKIDDSKPVFYLQGDARSELFRGNFINISSVLLRKDVFAALGGFDERCFGIEDFDLWVRLTKRYQMVYWFQMKIRCNWRPASLSRMNESRMREIVGYYLRCYHSEEFRDLKAISLENIYNSYKLLILHFAKKWKPKKAFEVFFESLGIHFFPKLLFYALLSLLGNFPIFVKTKILNPMFRKPLADK